MSKGIYPVYKQFVKYPKAGASPVGEREVELANYWKQKGINEAIEHFRDMFAELLAFDDRYVTHDYFKNVS